MPDVNRCAVFFLQFYSVSCFYFLNFRPCPNTESVSRLWRGVELFSWLCQLPRVVGGDQEETGNHAGLTALNSWTKAPLPGSVTQHKGLKKFLNALQIQCNIGKIRLFNETKSYCSMYSFIKSMQLWTVHRAKSICCGGSKAQVFVWLGPSLMIMSLH